MASFNKAAAVRTEGKWMTEKSRGAAEQSDIGATEHSDISAIAFCNIGLPEAAFLNKKQKKVDKLLATLTEQVAIAPLYPEL